MILHAWAIAEEGETDRGRSDLLRGIEEWRRTGAKYMSPYFSAVQAQIDIKAGHPGAALALLVEAQQVIERTNERWFAAEVFRLQGEAMLQIDPERKTMAAERFGESLATARAQGARFWELRAATSLARIDNEGSSREQLAKICESFTEGTALPDLKNAQLLSGHTAGAA
ncbi:hypothetical protein [Rhizobium gallicum]|uniref:hypothetical protein n=1 Tax=Rhizobium gallicum TaxID=56730 RepID=UPI001EF9A39F|nr:hypothetical protein [Rhizobium gallicum]ULJ76069.1 hypothetical protein L2W42_26830 [Rhizobium gallicum]